MPGPARLRPEAHVDHALDAGRLELRDELGRQQPLVADGPDGGHAAQASLHERLQARGGHAAASVRPPLRRLVPLFAAHRRRCSPSSSPRPRARRARARCATGSAPARRRSARWRAPPRGSGELERKAAREVAILEGRLATPRRELNAAEARLAATQTRLDAARRRVTRLRKRLAEVRVKLAGLLRERYMGDQPDFVTVVLHADGFPQLLETLQFVRRVERADTHVLDLVRAARADAGREQRVLTALAGSASSARRPPSAPRRDALAGITAGLRERQRRSPAPTPPGSPRSAAPARGRRQRRDASSSRLLAARARAAARRRPRRPVGDPVADRAVRVRRPEPPAQLRQRLRLLPDARPTWKGLGGSTPHAYQASKAEQDRLAARLWAGGAGAHNWVCAGLVDA